VTTTPILPAPTDAYMSADEYRVRLRGLVDEMHPGHLAQAIDLLAALNSSPPEESEGIVASSVVREPVGTRAQIPAIDIREALGEAQRYLRGKEWRPALGKLEAVIRENPEMRESLAVFRATCFLKIGLPELALKSVESLRLDRMAEKECYLIGKLLAEIRVHESAARFVSRAIALNPENTGALELLEKLQQKANPKHDLLLRQIQKKLSPMVVDIEPYMSGGMAFIYRGYHQKLHQEIAIKALRPTFAKMPEAVDRFLLEAVTLINIQHPHLLEVYSILKDDQVVSYVMELLEGAESTEQRVKDKGPYPWTAALKVFVAVTDALVQCHKRQVVHRDIKPDNVLLLPDGRIKLIDLGAAEYGTQKNAGKENLFVGNLRYSPPEALSKPILGTTADIYSLAVLFHDLVMGVPDGSQGMPPDPTTFPEEVESNLRSRGVSRLLLKILLKSLSFKADKRYPDASALREALSTLPVVGPPR